MTNLTAKLMQNEDRWCLILADGSQLEAPVQPETFLAALGMASEQTLVIDLSQVNILDLGGIRFLLNVRLTLAEHGIVVVLQNLQ